MSPAPIPMDALVALVHEAGAQVMNWYGRAPSIEEKEDRSPLTAADRAAHACLVDGLAALHSEIPVLSEESQSTEIEGREGWERFWLVDPLDGTKEFIKGTGEFTVNVALIHGSRPVLGVVHAPALGTTYRAREGWGAEMSRSDGAFQPISVRAFDSREPVLVGSRDHAGPAVETLARLLGPGVEFTSMGSSLKFCLVAEGRADLYLRDRPTMEWDTGAAQCVVEQAGGGVYGLEDPGAPTSLRYNKTTLRNPQFVCVGDLAGPWSDLVQAARPSK